MTAETRSSDLALSGRERYINPVQQSNCTDGGACVPLIWKSFSRKFFMLRETITISLSASRGRGYEYKRSGLARFLPIEAFGQCWLGQPG